jgi:aminopeptidase YwaD
MDLASLLAQLCAAGPDRRPGSAGNEAVVCPRFPVLGWEGQPGTLTIAGQTWPVHPSPYAAGWRGAAPIRAAATEAELASDLVGSVVLLHGELAASPLTPKDYPFYSSERDERIIARLESSGAVAVLAATGRSPELAGSLDPFPLIEDGAFAVPTGNLTERDGGAVLACLPGRRPPVSANLDLPARRWESSARNVVATRGDQSGRVTVVAHIDTKPGTPGAIDNATGVVVLCRVGELLADWRAGVELLAVNGEDHYAASGELDYLAATDLSEVRLAVNIDGAGLRGGHTAWSAYGVPDDLDLSALAGAPGLQPGPPWPQSDHMVFAAAGRPAVALTSTDFARVMQEVAHSPDDTPGLVDVELIDQAARAIAALVRSMGRSD